MGINSPGASQETPSSFEAPVPKKDTKRTHYLIEITCPQAAPFYSHQETALYRYLEEFQHSAVKPDWCSTAQSTSLFPLYPLHRQIQLLWVDESYTLRLQRDTRHRIGNSLPLLSSIPRT